MDFQIWILAGVCISYLISALLWRIETFKSLFYRVRLPYPPGPPQTSWITGNLSDIPLERQWLLFTKWAKVYGDLTYFRVLHKHNIIINRREAAIELLEKRSSNYSSRPEFAMGNLMGWDFSTTFKTYGDAWRSHRRLLQQYFKPEVTRNYREIQIRKIHDMLYQFLLNPDDFLSHIRHASGAIIMSAVYAHDVQTKHDHYVEISEKAMGNLTVAVLPGTFLVNTISSLRHLPSWLPGTGFKRFGQETKILTTQMLNDPIRMVQRLMDTGKVRPCIAADMLENCHSEAELDDIKSVCATCYAAGADTSVSSVQTFFYAMVNFPEVQEKAREEIYRVIGDQRLPTFDDLPSLPYSQALVRETLRWQPVAPLGIPHTASADDIYEGYYIPEGTTLMPNVWAMTRDPATYKDPETFNPSRFFNEDGSLNDDDVGYVFGFGRRICPGRHFALAAVWLSIVSVLATLNIRKKKDAMGREIPVDKGYNAAVSIHPLPFECDITPRSEVARTLIQDSIAQRD